MATDADFTNLLINTCTIQRKTRVVLSSGINASVTVLPVNATGGLDSAGTVTLDAEAVTYTALDTPNLTIGTVAAPATRGANGTTAAVHSGSASVRDQGGQAIFAWADNAANIACRLEDASRIEVEAGQDRKIVVAAYNLMLPAGTSITEDDRVVIGGKTYSVLIAKSVEDDEAEHHVEAVLDLVKAA